MNPVTYTVRCIILGFDMTKALNNFINKYGSIILIIPVSIMLNPGSFRCWTNDSVLAIRGLV